MTAKKIPPIKEGRLLLVRRIFLLIRKRLLLVGKRLLTKKKKLPIIRRSLQNTAPLLVLPIREIRLNPMPPTRAKVLG